MARSVTCMSRVESLLRKYIMARGKMIQKFHEDVSSKGHKAPGAAVSVETRTRFVSIVHGSLHLVPFLVIQIWLYMWAYEHLDSTTTGERMALQIPGALAAISFLLMIVSQSIVDFESEPDSLKKITKQGIMPPKQREFSRAWILVYFLLIICVVFPYFVIMYRYAKNEYESFSLITLPPAILIVVTCVVFRLESKDFIFSDINREYLRVLKQESSV